MCKCVSWRDNETGYEESDCTHINGSQSGCGLGRVGQREPVLYIDTVYSRYVVHHDQLGKLTVFKDGHINDWDFRLSSLFVGRLSVVIGADGKNDITKGRWYIESHCAQGEIIPSPNLRPAVDQRGVFLSLDDALAFIVGAFEEGVASKVHRALEFEQAV